MTDPDKHKIEQGIGELYLAMYRDALEERDYFKNLADSLAYATLVNLGIKEPTKQEIKDYMDKVGGKKDLW